MGVIDSIMADVRTLDKKGEVNICTVKELMERKFGVQLPHYAQQYLFAGTGLRVKAFYSVSGPPQSCKTPLVVDLLGLLATPVEDGGNGGAAILYEMEDKISPSLVRGVLGARDYVLNKSFQVVREIPIDGAMKHISKQVLPAYKKNARKYNIPIGISMDSVGGAAASDTAAKLAEGAIGKGFYDKAHYMKYFCENAGMLIGDIPLFMFCVNQEKPETSQTYGPPQNRITGGLSQVFKDGCMIRATFKTLATGLGKIITLKTIKSSFSDARRIELKFSWNANGASWEDMYGHRFHWALASAKCLASPEYSGEKSIKDIIEVSVSDADLVTCPTLGLRSVQPEEFEAALFAAPEILDALYLHQKIERIKTLDEYADYVKAKRAGKSEESDEAAAKPKEKEKEKKAAKPVKAAKPSPKKISPSGLGGQSLVSGGPVAPLAQAPADFARELPGEGGDEENEPESDAVEGNAGDSPADQG